MFEALKLVEDDQVRFERLQTGFRQQHAQLADHTGAFLSFQLRDVNSGPAKPPAQFLEPRVQILAAFAFVMLHTASERMRETLLESLVNVVLPADLLHPP